MDAAASPLEVVVRGRTFRLNAPAHERDALAGAIHLVQTKCDAVAATQPSADSERVLLLVALELAAQRASASSENNENNESDEHAKRVAALQAKLDAALLRASSASQA